MRAFIGIEFSREVKERIIEKQRMVRNISDRGRWKYIDNFHLTLKFLGEVNDEQVRSIYENMGKQLAPISAFCINTKSLGYFRGNGYLRVVYIDIEEDKRLMELFKQVDEACSLSGIERERKTYVPHITIAQDVVMPSGFDVIKNEISQLREIKIPVKEVAIIKSQQINGKRIYSPVNKVVLK